MEIARLATRGGHLSQLIGIANSLFLQVGCTNIFYKKQHDTILITSQNFLPAKKSKHGISEFASSPFQRSCNKKN